MVVPVTPGYLESMGAQLVAGAFLTASSPQIVVNETFARGDLGPVGARWRIELDGERTPAERLPRIGNPFPRDNDADIDQFGVCQATVSRLR